MTRALGVARMACEAALAGARLLPSLVSSAAATSLPARATVNAPPTADTDRELLLRAAAGDDRAASALFDRFGSVLFAVAFRILRDRDEADEAVVQAFSQAWRDAARFESSRGSVAAWLTVIARSRSLDQLRARQRRQRMNDSASRSDPEVLPGMGTPSADPDDAVRRREREQHVAAAMAQLSPPQRTAIELAFFEGLSHSEIAARLNEPLGTVKTRVRLGMQKLRESLRPYFFESTA